MKRFTIATLLLAINAWAAEGKISGEVTLAKGMKLPKGAVLFISARPIGGGPPLAVAKLSESKLPAKFELGQGNSMMGGTFAGEVEITVRASQSGDPMNRQPGDLFGTLKTKVGAEKVKIALDQKI